MSALDRESRRQRICDCWRAAGAHLVNLQKPCGEFEAKQDYMMCGFTTYATHLLRSRPLEGVPTLVLERSLGIPSHRLLLVTHT